MPEERLPGGFVNETVLLDGTVRRRPTARSPYLRELLHLFQKHHWPGAPRHLGSDEQGRDVLQYVPGHVPWAGGDPAVHEERSLRELCVLVRQAHDLTQGHPLAEGGEVVCHNDLSPRNTVYRREGARLHPIALIDWDLAGPGLRIHDVAHLCWQFLGLGPGTDAAWAAERLRLVADAYGLPDADRARLVPAIIWWQERTRSGIEAGARDGDPALRELARAGVPARIRAAREWVTAQRQTLEAPPANFPPRLDET
ncbi:phosphotransferase [Streptomyces luomodiensis]|uniref:Phosphotransferase n=1 Tax=Streptomyces luomodiensis TaxID=3026192 RepID=A0ABY9UQZ5_9ACTN|nr:phosphotransferase [Streptomyces sp. SCA4-21]WNE93858.1 phosphotransferase [Streptomyces sp. SCA4-21]